MSKERDKILRRVQALYAKAASTDFGPEADAFTAKADKMMLDYQIAQAELAMDDPSIHDFQIRIFSLGENTRLDVARAQSGLMFVCALHCGVRSVPVPSGDGRLDSRAYAGSGMDLDYMDILYTNLFAHLVKTIDPRRDPELSEAENIYGLKTAGLSWRDVHARMEPGEPWERRFGVRYTGIMKKFCEERDLPRNMTGGPGAQQNYRDQYMGAYLSRLRDRLAALKDDHQEVRSGAEVVLFDKEKKLKEFIWEHYPEQRPHEPGCDCDRCHICDDKACQRSRCRAARMPARRGRVRQVRYNHSAVVSGHRAANTADLGQTGVRKREGGQLT